MAELKPCPFCGGEAKFVIKSNNSSHNSIGFSYRIECSKCNASPFTKYEETSVYMKKDGIVYETDISKVRKDKMIETWNRRVEDAKLSSEKGN